MWRDWWWTVHQCRCILDNSYEAEIKTIQNKLTLQQKTRLMDESEKKRSMFLCVLSVLRGVGEFKRV